MPYIYQQFAKWYEQFNPLASKLDPENNVENASYYTTTMIVDKVLSLIGIQNPHEELPKILEALKQMK